MRIRNVMLLPCRVVHFNGSTYDLLGVGTEEVDVDSGIVSAFVQIDVALDPSEEEVRFELHAALVEVDGDSERTLGEMDYAMEASPPEGTDAAAIRGPVVIPAELSPGVPVSLNFTVNGEQLAQCRFVGRETSDQQG